MKGCEVMMHKHNECENFCFVDVAKGICRLSGELVLIDTEVCGEFAVAPCCGNCEKFTADKELGLCSGYGKEYWTTAETRAVVCEGYVGRS